MADAMFDWGFERGFVLQTQTDRRRLGDACWVERSDARIARMAQLLTPSLRRYGFRIRRGRYRYAAGLSVATLSIFSPLKPNFVLLVIPPETELECDRLLIELPCADLPIARGAMTTAEIVALAGEFVALVHDPAARRSERLQRAATLACAVGGALLWWQLALSVTAPPEPLARPGLGGELSGPAGDGLRSARDR